MSLELAPGWNMDLERGPDWLFIRLHAPEDGNAEGLPLAQKLWQALEQQFTYRVVIELEDLPIMRSYLIGQLVILHKRICGQEGCLRLSGLSDRNQAVLSANRLDSRFPHFRNREEAIMGSRPNKPR